jgi:hypothetical protein
MPDLVKLYDETAGKGLVWISIDSEDDATTAADYLSRHHIPWTNYHDDDGSLGDPFNRWGFPLAVLIDAEGKVAFYKGGYEITDLRNAIAKLGPEFNGASASRASPK